MNSKFKFKIHSESLAFKRFIKIWHRKVEFPDGRIIDWDLVGQEGDGPHFATVFPYSTKSKTVRILKEYAQGINELRYTLVAGGFDNTKHANILDTAVYELSEEARLANGRMICLMDINSNGISELKWCRNRFMPFLCLDPEIDTNPKDRDLEELIIEEDVSLDEFMDIVIRGEMMLPAVQTGIMAINWLKANQLY
jgi:hypothetical protein